MCCWCLKKQNQVHTEFLSETVSEQVANAIFKLAPLGVMLEYLGSYSPDLSVKFESPLPPSNPMQTYPFIKSIQERSKNALLIRKYARLLTSTLIFSDSKKILIEDEFPDDFVRVVNKKIIWDSFAITYHEKVGWALKNYLEKNIEDRKFLEQKLSAQLVAEMLSSVKTFLTNEDLKKDLIYQFVLGLQKIMLQKEPENKNYRLLKEFISNAKKKDYGAFVIDMIAAYALSASLLAQCTLTEIEGIDKCLSSAGFPTIQRQIDESCFFKDLIALKKPETLLMHFNLDDYPTASK